MSRRKKIGFRCEDISPTIISFRKSKHHKKVITIDEKKWEKMQEIGFEPLFHLDDDFVELNGINRNLKTVKAISCIGGGWKKKIEKIVGDLN